jgi:hypothetical protein
LLTLCRVHACRVVFTGLVLQCPFGLGEVQRRKLIEDVRSRILGQSKDKKQRTTLSVLKKVDANVFPRLASGAIRWD